MKKSKGFTLVEMVVVLAVTSVLFTVIAVLSALTSGFVSSSREMNNKISDFNNAKTQINEFFSRYNSDYFSLTVLQDGSGAQITSINDSSGEEEIVAKIYYENGNLLIEELPKDSAGESEEKETLSIRTEGAESISFVLDRELKLILIEFDFKDFLQKIVVNVAGYIVE